MASRALQLVATLESHYGAPAAPLADGPFALILWEIVAYMADDARRAAAFAALRDRVGLEPQQILNAPPELLVAIAKKGGAIADDDRASRMRTAAALVMGEFHGDLRTLLQLPGPKAKKQLMRFPMIGEPGAEKILLFCGAQAVLALESNGLRVLVRLGFATAGKSYAATYRAVRTAMLEELPADFPVLTRAHLLLRQHGQ